MKRAGHVTLELKRAGHVTLSELKRAGHVTLGAEEELVLEL